MKLSSDSLVFDASHPSHFSHRPLLRKAFLVFLNNVNQSSPTSFYLDE